VGEHDDRVGAVEPRTSDRAVDIRDHVLLPLE